MPLNNFDQVVVPRNFLPNDHSGGSGLHTQ